MYRFTSLAILLFISVLAVACADPTADKPKAATGTASEPSASKPAGSETLTISPDTSKVEFVGAKVTRSHNGSFSKFSGTIDLVSDKLENSRVTVEIDTASISADDDKLTAHLKSPDFFDVAKFPRATFVSTEIKPGGEGGATHTITGNLEMHGVKKAITFPATIEVTSDAVTVKSEFAINRKDFGILYPGMQDDLIRDDVLMKLSINAPRSRS